MNEGYSLADIRYIVRSVLDDDTYASMSEGEVLEYYLKNKSNLLLYSKIKQKF